jgi:hypothetical protein
MPKDTMNYKTASSTIAINAMKAISKITWSNPSSITHGKVLSNFQLNATTSVNGHFAFSTRRN